MELVAVAAVAENGIIGDGPSVPWDLPEDVRLYRERVADHPVVIGRRTFESMQTAGDLPGATQVVLSRSVRSYPDPTVTVVAGAEAAVAEARATGADTAYVLGGAAVYELLQPRLDRMVLSRVHRRPSGDAAYPEFDRDAWRLAREEPHDGFTVEFWERRRTAADGDHGSGAGSRE